ncbi:hypothetical protein F5883DRAFT_644664 [Diaporthe sp. PMI_573]|nr:hypothetical protein F5883DRAFT_644664 [Diaporthaceae sp. PMI_573]
MASDLKTTVTISVIWSNLGFLIVLSVSGIEKPVHLNDRSAPGCGSAPIKEDSERVNDNSIRRPSPGPAADAGTATSYGEALNFKTPVKFSLWSRNPGDMYLGRPSQRPRA